jgi:hypothetical protein
VAFAFHKSGKGSATNGINIFIFNKELTFTP